MLQLRDVRAWPSVLIGAGLASAVVSGTVGLGWMLRAGTSARQGSLRTL